MLGQLKPRKGSVQSQKRLGRGIGSGLGKTSGKGSKGQKARSGGYNKVGFEGGQMPLYRRLPKRGFTNVFATTTHEVTTRMFATWEQSETVSIESLKKAGWIPNHAEKVKIILKGDVQRAIRTKGLAVSAGARDAIIKAGGSVE